MIHIRRILMNDWVRLLPEGLLIHMIRLLLEGLMAGPSHNELELHPDPEV